MNITTKFLNNSSKLEGVLSKIILSYILYFLPNHETNKHTFKGLGKPLSITRLSKNEDVLKLL